MDGWKAGTQLEELGWEVVLAWYETETQSTKSLSLHWLGWLLHCCFAFIYGSKTTAWKDLKQSHSPCMISHTENHVATALCLSFLLVFCALMTYLGCSKNLSLIAYVEVEKGEGAEVRGEDGLSFASNFWQLRLLLLQYSRFIPLQTRGNLFGPSKNGIRFHIEPTNQFWAQYAWGHIMQHVCWTSDTSKPLDVQPHPHPLPLLWLPRQGISSRLCGDVSEGQEVMGIKAILTVPIC